MEYRGTPDIKPEAIKREGEMEFGKKVSREIVKQIARKAIENAECFGTGKITAVREALEMEDIKLEDFQIEGIVAELIF